MSKTNSTSKLGTGTQVRELRDDELENVSGGLTVNWTAEAIKMNSPLISGIVVTKPTDVASWSWGMTQTGTS